MITLDWEIGQRVWVWRTDVGATEVLLDRVEVVGRDGGYDVGLRVRYERAVLGFWMPDAEVYRTREACEEQNRAKEFELR